MILPAPRGLACTVLLALSLPLAAQSSVASDPAGLSAASDAPVAQPAVPATADPASLDAERLPKVDKSLLLDVLALDGTATSPGYVAVGERGHVLLSADGVAWTQAEHVPTRATLNSVAGNGDLLWAVGHDGVILHSSDAGQHWQRQRVAPYSPDDSDPSHGIPLLDVFFVDAQHGYAIGAYRLLLETRDGGASWTQRPLTADVADADTVVASPSPSDAVVDDGVEEWNFSADELVLEDNADPHLNAIARTGSGALVIAGERGAVFRSRDLGDTWQRLKLPYQGSMFGVLAWQDDHILVFGLRGNVFESRDLGDSWIQLESGTRANLMGGSALPDGGVVIVGANGIVLTRASADAPLVTGHFVTAAGEASVLADALADGAGGYLVVGERGVDRYRPASDGVPPTPSPDHDAAGSNAQ